MKLGHTVTKGRTDSGLMADVMNIDSTLTNFSLKYNNLNTSLMHLYINPLNIKQYICP